jgi:hypothetical protein
MRDSTEVSPDVDRRIIIWSLLATMLSTIVVILGTAGLTASVGSSISGLHESLGPRELGWIVAQAFWLTMPGVAVAFLLQKLARRGAMVFGALLVLGTPALMLADAITFHWIGERFLSTAMFRVATELRSGLLGHVAVGMLIGGLSMVLVVVAVFVVTLWSSRRIARRWGRTGSPPGPKGVLAGSAVLSLVLALPSLIDMDQTRNDMARNSSRHPFCVIGMFSFHSPGRIDASREQVVNSSPMERAVMIRDHQQRRLGVDPSTMTDQPLPDVVIVVVESFRQELIDPEVMPVLWQYAERGLHCRSHFSGGNATNHGMFSLLNGLEAIWYERPVRYSPLLSRLFRQAGYELGFFAGHNDWRKFNMDGYLSAEHFDVFETSRPDGLASDRRATQLASDFLSGAATPQQRRPRLAVLYLYATHATYHSYHEDRRFSPAADERFVIPYPQSSRDQVWNRYKNSARTVDRFLSAVMREDRVVVVTGDHGESFLEDGTIGHGIRISAFQNMTPAVLYVPNRPPRLIEAPTSHADLLPTLLAAIGIPISDERVFDGVDLFNASDLTLTQRVFVTRNYLRDDVALIGPWTLRQDQPFGYRANVSLRKMHVGALNGIDRQGYEFDLKSPMEIDMALQRWLESRLNAYVPEPGNE